MYSLLEGNGRGGNIKFICVKLEGNLLINIEFLYKVVLNFIVG